MHSNQNHGVHLIKINKFTKQRACWSAPYIVNELNKAAAKEFFNILPSIAETTQLAVCDRCKDVNVC